MNRYILIRRLRAPAILLLAGTIALLHQMGAIEHPWRLFWALLFILLGVILLAERTVLSLHGDLASGFPGTPYPGAPTPQSPAPESAIVPARSHDSGNDLNGGQS